MSCVSPKLYSLLKKTDEFYQQAQLNGFKQTAENTRDALAQLTQRFCQAGNPISLIIDDIVDTDYAWQIPIRIYHPEPDNTLPVIVFFHGGGHMAGSIDVYDPICRKLAEFTSHIVIAVEYRLSPEHPYPAGLMDACHVARNTWEVLAKHQLSFLPSLRLAGDSAGGALAASVSHYLQEDSDPEIDAQILIYPSLDYTMSLPSIEKNGQGYLLYAEKISWYFDHYFQHNENRQAVSPLFMDITSAYPATFLVTAGFDPLCVEGEAYVAKLAQHGVKTEHLHLEDMIHAFMNLDILVPDQVELVYNKINSFLNN